MDPDPGTPKTRIQCGSGFETLPALNSLFFKYLVNSPRTFLTVIMSLQLLTFLSQGILAVFVEHFYVLMRYGTGSSLDEIIDASLASSNNNF